MAGIFTIGAAPRTRSHLDEHAAVSRHLPLAQADPCAAEPVLFKVPLGLSAGLKRYGLAYTYMCAIAVP